MQPVMVIEWYDGVVTEWPFTHKAWIAGMACLKLGMARQCWRKYPAMNQAA